MYIVNNRKIFYSLSLILVCLSLAALLFWGLKLGIDFKGGSILEVSYPLGRPGISLVKNNLESAGFAYASIRPAGESAFIVRTLFLEEAPRSALLRALSQSGEFPVKTERFNSIGPSIGSELRTKALLSLGLVLLAIVLFIAFAFRQVSEPVSSFKYGLIAIVALLHDVIVPAGVFAVLGKFAGFEIDSLFITALLVILGFSIHDTIVVFDRVRENLRLNKDNLAREPFAETVGRSVTQTFARSINTSLTTILALLAIFFAGPEATRSFSLALLVGIVAGTYSSIFIASNLLVTLELRQRPRPQKGD